MELNGKRPSTNKPRKKKSNNNSTSEDSPNPNAESSPIILSVNNLSSSAPPPPINTKTIVDDSGPTDINNSNSNLNNTTGRLQKTPLELKDAKVGDQQPLICLDKTVHLG